MNKFGSRLSVRLNQSSTETTWGRCLRIRLIKIDRSIVRYTFIHLPYHPIHPSIYLSIYPSLHTYVQSILMCKYIYINIFHFLGVYICTSVCINKIHTCNSVYVCVCVCVCVLVYLSFLVNLKDYTKNQAEVTVAKGRPNYL